jgi:phenylpropionate dioxygenase-like ring-hydroxylating dioxygenase large terminal subunit
VFLDAYLNLIYFFLDFGRLYNHFLDSVFKNNIIVSTLVTSSFFVLNLFKAFLPFLFLVLRTMFAVLLSLSTSVVIGLFSCLVLRQYRRVQKRDATRRRIQNYGPASSKSSSSTSTYPCDPLDHSLYWYPVAFSNEINSGSGRPFGFYLLNEPLCLYRTNDGQVVCVLDLCPHRSAPLSLGQITKEGNLECVYHGWQYGANGQCVYIPSVSKKSNTASLICARTVPVHEQYGFIWVWPGKRELANSDFIPHRLLADLQNINGDFLLSPEESFYLDIPYDIMVDNLLDMAHIDFTHDGTIGKRSRASCIRSEIITPSPFFSTNSDSASFKVTRHEQPVPASPNEFSHFHFIPPCFVRLEHHESKEGNLLVQIFIILPSAEKKMRLLMQFYRNFARYKWIEYIPGYDYLTEKLIKKIVDQDVLLLNGIHRNIVEMGAKPLGTIVSADAPIKAFRRYQSRALAKFETFYVKQGAWMSSTTKSSGDGTDEMDIEDLKMERIN